MGVFAKRSENVGKLLSLPNGYIGRGVVRRVETTQALFQVLKSRNVDHATGIGLCRIGNSIHLYAEPKVNLGNQLECSVSWGLPGIQTSL
jgi:hypothetical protein